MSLHKNYGPPEILRATIKITKQTKVNTGRKHLAFTKNMNDHKCWYISITKSDQNSFRRGYPNVLSLIRIITHEYTLNRTEVEHSAFKRRSIHADLLF